MIVFHVLPPWGQRMVQRLFSVTYLLLPSWGQLCFLPSQLASQPGAEVGGQLVFQWAKSEGQLPPQPVAPQLPVRSRFWVVVPQTDAPTSGGYCTGRLTESDPASTDTTTTVRELQVIRNPVLIPIPFPDAHYESAKEDSGCHLSNC